MQSAIDLQNPATIRAYFEKVRELAKSGEQYPINLDDVWPLVYAEKSKAVRALKRVAIEHTDYQIINTNGEKSGRGRPEQVYKLAVPCLKFFVACKHRGVFEVYRQVFHAVLDQAEQVQSVGSSAGQLLILYRLLTPFVCCSSWISKPFSSRCKLLLDDIAILFIH